MAVGVTATVTALPGRGCTWPGCGRAARMAAGPTRALIGLDPETGDPSSTLGITVEQIFYDWRAAPASARWVCKEHGLDLVATLVRMYVSDDDEVPLDPAGAPVEPNARFLAAVALDTEGH